MSHQSRRNFLLTTAGAALAGSASLKASTRTATDWVELGNSGLKVTRLALGTGSVGGRVQRELGQDAFNRLVRHAYDRGIRFFETADAYSGMQQMLATALKSVPRDSYKLMTKYRIRNQEDIRGTIDRLRSELNTEYFDILLMHCVRSPQWPEETARLQDEIQEAQHRKIVAVRGASVHGLPGLRRFPENKWLEVALLRTNHKGVKMDTESTQDVEQTGNVDEVFRTASGLHKRGVGILGMKLIGEGRFTSPEDRQTAINKVMRSGHVDAVTIGFKNTAEIDEAIDRMNQALKS
jgi:aryl-alcohol dehydrogenase-like predicted oxidoreductase